MFSDKARGKRIFQKLRSWWRWLSWALEATSHYGQRKRSKKCLP